jgi:hypothetical protein
VGEDMSYKLSDFYVGVVDFFSILLPGALFTLLLKDSYIESEILNSILPEIQKGVQEWAIFIVASYLLGHFVNLVASYLDYVYDFITGGKRTSYALAHYFLLMFYCWDHAYAFIARLVRRKQEGSVPALMSRRTPVRRIRQRVLQVRNFMRKRLISGRDPKALPIQVMRIRNERLREAMERDLITNNDLINAFQWAKANLMLQHATVATEVQRLEADSKFFRSLVVVLVIISIISLFKLAVPALLACIFLTILSSWGYVKRRWKSVTLAYMYYIASENMPNPEFAVDDSPQ